VQDDDEVMRSQQTDTGEEVDEAESLSGDEKRGRPTKKRSFDDLQAEDQSQGGMRSPSKQNDHGHTRKKSRETQQEAGHDRVPSETESLRGKNSAEEDQVKISPVEASGDLASNVQDPPLEQGQPMNEEHSEPKKKRSRDQFDKDEGKELEGSEESNGIPVKATSESIADEEPALAGLSRRTTGEPEKKRHRESSLENLLPHEQEGNAPKVWPEFHLSKLKA